MGVCYKNKRLFVKNEDFEINLIKDIESKKIDTL